jgi:uncharacterized membrane protein
MATVKKPMTTCGLQVRRELGGGRAKVIARDGNMLTYRWPCGYEKTETLTIGRGRMRKAMSPDMVKFFASYWAQGVTYECPRCRRKAMRAK